MIIAHISDFHVTSSPAELSHLGDTTTGLKRAVAHLNALEPTPDLVLATGDLCHPGDAADYRLLRELLSPISFPVYLIPGNHDRREALRNAFGDHAYLPEAGPFLHYVLEDYALRLIGLDTVVPGEDQDGGVLCEQRLCWLADRLREAPERPTLVFMHHPPVAFGLPYIDRLGCDGGEALGRVVSRHAQIEAIVCGHVHRAIQVAWCGTQVISAPSTCVQFPLETRDDIAIEPVHEPLACRIYLWQEARFLSHLSYIP